MAVAQLVKDNVGQLRLMTHDNKSDVTPIKFYQTNELL